MRLDRELCDDIRSKWVQSLFLDLNLAGCEDTPIAALSGGERKRLSLAVEVWYCSEWPNQHSFPKFRWNDLFLITALLYFCRLWNLYFKPGLDTLLFFMLIMFSWVVLDMFLKPKEFGSILIHVGPYLIFVCLYTAIRPPLWSSGQSSWLQIRRPGFDSRH
jgi:hypothetical protein